MEETKIYTLSSLQRTGIYSTDPQIRLCGKWLKKAGFEAGDHIKIITTNKCLIIVPDEKKQEDL